MLHLTLTSAHSKFPRASIEVDPNKVAAVVNLPAPNKVHEVRVFCLEKQEDPTWRPVMFISRALTPVEIYYADMCK